MDLADDRVTRFAALTGPEGRALLAELAVSSTPRELGMPLLRDCSAVVMAAPSTDRKPPTSLPESEAEIPVPTYPTGTLPVVPPRCFATMNSATPRMSSWP